MIPQTLNGCPVVQVFILIMLLASCEIDNPIPTNGIAFEDCCFSDDPYTCALALLPPGHEVTLQACNVYVHFPRITRWDLAMDLAETSCTDEDPYWCAGELARKLCPRKLDPSCSALIIDGVGFEACVHAVEPGADVPEVCSPLFPEWSL